MTPKPEGLVLVTEDDLNDGDEIWWPLAPNNWGHMTWHPGKWCPSAVIYRVQEKN